ncbi:Transcription initiation factor TFIID subunit 10, partial [Modicella reniformis]
MSDGSNPVEDTSMESPRPTQASGSSTPVQAPIGSDSTMIPSIGSSIQTPTHIDPSAEATSVAPTIEAQQASPLTSAPSTPSNSRAGSAIATSVSSPMTGIVSTSTPPPTSANPEPASSILNPAATQQMVMPSPARAETPGATNVRITTSTMSNQRQSTTQEEQQQRQHQEHQLLMLQKQAQLAQLQLQAHAHAHAASTAAAGAASSTGSGSVAQHSQAVGAALQSRKEEELNRKDRTLAEFLPMMENYNPIIPDSVTDYYLSRTGFDCDDVRIKRLLALAAQKFISEIATDAFQYCKVRQQSQKRPAPGKEKKTVLTMEDLSDALGEYGINAKKPDYY